MHSVLFSWFWFGYWRQKCRSNDDEADDKRPLAVWQLSRPSAFPASSLLLVPASGNEADQNTHIMIELRRLNSCCLELNILFIISFSINKITAIIIVIPKVNVRIMQKPRQHVSWKHCLFVHSLCAGLMPPWNKWILLDFTGFSCFNSDGFGLESLLHLGKNALDHWAEVEWTLKLTPCLRNHYC